MSAAAWLRRELAIVFGARVTWIALSFAAIVVGHGFVLAIDLYSAASRSAIAGALMQKEMDPLSGIIRPTLGGCQLAVAVLVPVISARLLAVEKERNTFGALALAVRSPGVIALRKMIAALIGSSFVMLPPLVLIACFVPRIDVAETSVAFLGHVLHLAFVVAFATAAAAWTRTVAQATAIALIVSVASWAMEAGEGFAALAWLGPLEAVSVSRQLASFEAGIVHVGAVTWFAIATIGSALLAWVGVQFFDLEKARRALLGGVVLGLTIAGLLASTSIHRAHDWTELARASLPPAAVTELRKIPEPIEIEVWLDRDDSRRRQLERDALAKLRLARSDIEIKTPLDNQPTTHKDDQYGRIVIRVGGAESRETRSTSRRELVFLIFEASNRPPPDWSQPSYPGYPFVVEGVRRTLVRVVSYVALPLSFLVLGFASPRRWRRKR